MPCLNASKYIEDSLRSIFEQSETDIQLIVIDGGSIDGTLDILRSNKWKIDELISEPDDGPQDALNKGFSLALGDVFCWLNADDVYTYRHTFATIKRLFSEERLQFAYGHSVSLNIDGQIMRTSYAWPMTLRDYQLGSNIFTGSLFFSRVAWEKFGGFSNKYQVIFEYELADFLFANYQPSLINKHIAGLRHYPGTLSNRLQNQILQECMNFRGHRKSKDLAFEFRRILGLAKVGLVWHGVKNKMVDRYAGEHWSNLFAKQD